MATIPTVTAWDLNTNTLISTLQAAQKSYSVRMNDAGEFSLKIDLTDALASQQAAAIIALKGNPFKVIFSDSNYSIRYSGIAWNTTINNREPVLTIAGKGLTSYFTQLVANNTYNQPISPAQLLANVVTDVQNQPAASIRITPRLALNTPPPSITPTYTAGQRVTAAQIIADCTAAVVPGIGGVDYYLTDTFTNGAPTHTLNISAPRCGRDQTVSQAVIDLSQAITWDWPTNAAAAGNQAIVVGSAPTGGNTAPVSVKDVTFPRGGLGEPPLLQMVYQFNRLTTTAQLDQQANALLQMFGNPVATPTVTLPLDYAPLPLGSFQIGDDVRVYSPHSPWFPHGISDWWRIVAYTVTYPDEGVPTCQLTLNRPPVF